MVFGSTYVWTKNRIVYVKKEDGSGTVRTNSLECLKNLDSQ